MMNEHGKRWTEVVQALGGMRSRLYTQVMTHAIRVSEQRLARELTNEERIMLEAMAEGMVYTMVPLIAATLAELNPTPVTPPMGGAA